MLGRLVMVLKALLVSTLLAGNILANNIKAYAEWHEKCVETEDVAVIDTYIEKYQAKIDANPGDQLAKVYLGSAYTLRSAASPWGPQKLEYLKRGGKLMDEAAGAAWEDPRVRFIRGANGYKVPKRFKRRPVAVEDFTFVLPIAIAGKKGLSVSERQSMLYYAWKVFEEEGDEEKATQAKEKCKELDSNSWYGKEASK